MSKGIAIAFREDAELFELLNKYRITLGWTWKRILFVGFAEIIAKNGDNPDLVVEIANYLEKNR